MKATAHLLLPARPSLNNNASTGARRGTSPSPPPPLRRVAAPMASLRPLDPSLATAATARPRLVPASLSAGAGAGALLPGRRRRGFSCRAGSAASEITKEKNRTEPSKLDAVLLRVCLEHQVKYGEHVGIVGSTEELGSWNKHVQLDWTPDGWVCQLELPGEALAEFKFVVVSKGGKEKTWEGGNNRVVELPKDGAFHIVCHWDRTQEPLDLSGASKADRYIIPEKVADVSVAGNGDLTGSDPSNFGGQWQGSEAVFMRSNEHGNRPTGCGIQLGLVEWH